MLLWSGTTCRLYRTDVNLFVWPETAGRLESKAFHLSTNQGYQLAGWSAGGLRYEAVSDMNAQELAEFRRLMAFPQKKTINSPTEMETAVQKSRLRSSGASAIFNGSLGRRRIRQFKETGVKIVFLTSFPR